MHLTASSIAAEKAPRWVWHAARLLYAAWQGQAAQFGTDYCRCHVTLFDATRYKRIQHMGQCLPTLSHLGVRGVEPDALSVLLDRLGVRP